MYFNSHFVIPEELRYKILPAFVVLDHQSVTAKEALACIYLGL